MTWDDPLDDWCGACGAPPAVDCAPDCPSRLHEGSVHDDEDVIRSSSSDEGTDDE